MRRFAATWRAAVEAPDPRAAAAALTAYLRTAPPLDAAWATWFLAGHRLAAAVSPVQIRRWALEETGVPEWLFETSRATVGNLAETVAHLLDGTVTAHDWPLHELVEERLAPLASASPVRRRQLVVATWRELRSDELDVWNRLLTGALRPRPAAAVVARALADAFGGEAGAIAEALVGEWTPAAEALARLVAVPSRGGGGATLFPALVVPPTRSGDHTAAGAEPPHAQTVGGHTFAAVLLYAQRSDGGRGNLYSGLTLGAWRDGELVPVAKVEAGLPAAEALELDRWVRRNIVDRFGPVRHVKPELVFEVACEGVLPSARHKAGLTLRAPRVLRRLRDRRAEEAATLADLRDLLRDGDAEG